MIDVFFLCTHNSASLGLFPSARARVHSNIDIDIDIDIALQTTVCKYAVYITSYSVRLNCMYIVSQHCICVLYCTSPYVVPQ